MLAKLDGFLRQTRFSISSNQWLVRTLGLCIGAEKGGQPAPGLLIIQIDGLSKLQLQRALETKSLPFMQSLISKEAYHLHSLYSGLPSSTPAVQGELFYGVKGCVPAFSFKQHEDLQTVMMVEPSAAAKVEKKLKGVGSEPLLEDGSSYCNLFTGGAKESSFCASSVGWSNIMPTNNVFKMVFFAIVKIPNIVRAIILALVELGVSIVDLCRGVIAGKDFFQELKYVPMRVGACTILRELVETGVSLDVTRGVPIVHANFIGYDEQAHRRGPDSKFAHWSLKGIDRALHRIWKTAKRCPYRDYDIWIYSDHGQETVAPYPKVAGQTIQSQLNAAFIEQLELDEPDHLESCRDKPIESRERKHQRTPLRASWLGLPRLSKSSAKSDPVAQTRAQFGLPEVVAMGPIGLVYLPYPMASESKKKLAVKLVNYGNIPIVCMVVDRGLASESLIAVTKDGEFKLPQDTGRLFGLGHPFIDNIANDFCALVKHPDSGDLLISGWAGDKRQSLSFRMENGSHAGPGINETHAFALLPGDTKLPTTDHNYLRLLTLRQAALSFLGRDSHFETDNKSVNKHRQLQVIPQGKVFDNNHCLRVLTYNIHSCIGMDGQVSTARIARVIAHFQPDVVCLQEVDLDGAKTNHIDQAELIAQELSMDIQFHPIRHLEKGRFSNAVLTDLPMRRVKAGGLSVPKQTLIPLGPFNKARGALWVEVQFNGKPVNIIVTHLGLTGNERQQQVSTLLSQNWLGNEHCVGPTVLCGDFNASSMAPAIKRLSGRLINAQVQFFGRSKIKTFPSRYPTTSIDHFFVDDSSIVRSVLVGATSLAKVASDHLPLVVDIEISDKIEIQD